MRARGVLRHLAVLTLALAPLASFGKAEPARASESAEQILARVRELDAGPRRWTDRTQEVTLRIVDGVGKERLREIESFSKRYPDGEEKVAVFLLAPPELRGTGFLQWAHPGREDEQWLYLPESKRIRQITARFKNESFVGSDFSYRDMEVLNEIARWTEKEAEAQLEGEESVAGMLAYVIAYQPRHPETVGYTALRTWLRKEDLSATRVEFQNNDDAPKVLELAEIRSVGGIPTPHRLVMRNLKRGGHTVVEVKAVRYNRGIDDEVFTHRALERGPR